MLWKISALALTAIAASLAAAYVGSLHALWHNLTPPENSSGPSFTSLFYGVFGLLGGLLVGAILSRLLASFWAAQFVSLGIVAAICLIITLISRLSGEIAPRIDGQRLNLDFEFKLPTHWQPDNAAKSVRSGKLCSLTTINGHQLNGTASWQHSAPTDGQWVAQCTVPLFSSRPNRYANIKLGKIVDVTFVVPLPALPTPQNQQWTDWTPTPSHHHVRCRVRQVSFVDPDQLAALQRQETIIAAIPQDAPLTVWLPYFEEGTTGFPPSEFGKIVPAAARDSLTRRPQDLAPLLASHDRQTVRRALFAAVTLNRLPLELIAPLTSAGQTAITLIQEAQAAALLPDPDYDPSGRAAIFIYLWTSCMQIAGPHANASYLATLHQLDKALVDPKSPAELSSVANFVRQQIESLAEAADTPPPASQPSVPR